MKKGEPGLPGAKFQLFFYIEITFFWLNKISQLKRRLNTLEKENNLCIKDT